MYLHIHIHILEKKKEKKNGLAWTFFKPFKMFIQGSCPPPDHLVPDPPFSSSSAHRWLV